MAPLFMVQLGMAAESDKQSGKDKQSANIYFSVADQFDAPLSEPQTNFDCTQKIFTVIELSEFPHGRHDLSVIWRDPSEKAREKTEYPFTVRSSQTRLWAWLSLSRAAGAGMLQWIDPAAGLEEFIGIWKVEVKVNGKIIDSKEFEVSC